MLCTHVSPALAAAVSESQEISAAAELWFKVDIADTESQEMTAAAELLFNLKIADSEILIMTPRASWPDETRDRVTHTWRLSQRI